MGFLIFETLEEAEAEVKRRREEAEAEVKRRLEEENDNFPSTIIIGGEERFCIKRKIDGASDEYLMEDGSFWDGKTGLIYGDFDMLVHVVPPPDEKK